MEVLSKNSLIILILFLSFMGCKDNDKPEPINEVVYEDWHLLPDSVIRYGYRDIRATELVGDELFILAGNSFYFLDTASFDRDKSINYIYENYISLGLNQSVKHNNHYLLFQRYLRRPIITIWDAVQPMEQINFEFSLAGFIQNFDECFGLSSINDLNEFDLVYRTYSNKTVDYKLMTLAIDHTPGKFAPIALITKRESTLLSYKDSINAYPKTEPRVFKFGDLSFVSIDGSIFRFQDGELLDTNRYNFNNMFEHNGSLYAQNIWVGYFADELIRDYGLLRSDDQGETWQYIGYGSDLGLQNIKSFGEKLILYKQRNIAIIDLENGKIIEKDLTHLNAAIHSIEKIGNKVIVGTDAGVYYKSWESFLNK